ncbi:MAG TPA: M48 family peptidase, partial [Syntrophomonas sp.]|nr:M48 family peptidase [Syntrophomonas sp.]
QPQIPIVPNRVVIKEQKTRWGSCSSKHNLNYNFKTVMAPLPVLDYIVVHEMCHLVHLNHSREFWNLVESIIPEYRQHKEWLKMNGASFYL